MPKPSPGGSVMDAQCPSRLVLDRIADKWTALIIQVLAHGTKRYAALQREIGGISQKMLTQTLRSLERDEIGRASCRERVESSVGGGTYKKKSDRKRASSRPRTGATGRGTTSTRSTP